MEVLTAQQSEVQQRAVAAGLARNGLRAGDRVALLTSSTPVMLSAILGALRTGVVPVLLNHGLLPHERDALLADADPHLAVDDRLLARWLDEDRSAELAAHPLARPMHYTSGTTGVPKGVWSGVLTEAEAAALATEEADLWGFDPSDRHLVCSPFHHSVSIRFGGGTLLAGGSVIVLDRFTGRAAAEAIAAHRPTTTFMVPAHLQRLFADLPEGAAGATVRDGADAVERVPGLGSFRLMVHAGAPCPPPLKGAAIAAFGVDRVWEFYGSTEGQFTACAAPEWLDRPGTVGRARPHRRLTADDDGTIWCAAPPYARFEYWGDPAKTADAWRHEPDGSRAFTVRDLGRLDDDGYLYLDGRRDDLVITGGVNVYPAEVEAALAHAPGVQQVAVFGVDDERWGQRVCAAVVAEPTARPVPTPGAVLAHARAQLAPYKCPKDVYLVDELPHTATGKVQRRLLPELLGLRVARGDESDRAAHKEA